MGKGTIVGGGADGYYDLQLDITLGNIVSERDKLRVKEAELRLKLSEAKLKKSDAQAKLTSTNQALTLAIDAYNAGPSDAQRAAVESATRAERDARTALKDASQLVNAITADQNAYKNQLAELKKLIESASPLETEKSNIQSRINTLQSNIATATATKQAALSDLNSLNAALSAAQLLYSQDPSTENRDALTRAERNQAIGAQKYAEADAEVTRIQNDLTAAEASLADVSTSILKLEELKAESASVQANINHIEEVTKPAAIADRTEKQTALNNATEARKAAQAAYNADPSPANLQALNDAIAAESAALTAYTQAISNLEKVESDLTAVEVRLLDIEKAISYQAAVRPAWCVDLSESLTGTVSTVEINGDTRDGVLIRPGYTDSAAYIDKRDGVVSLPQTMSPYSTFFNWALKPAVQRWRPQYRSAVIDKIDYDANTCTITLDESPSMESPPLVLNDPVTVANVPINYMSCNSGAFSVGDRVVVEFTLHKPNQPTVIGFRSNPRPCNSIAVGYSYKSDTFFQRAIMWRSATDAIDMGALPGDNSSNAIAVSKNGQIALCVSHSTYRRPFLWSASGISEISINSYSSIPGGFISTDNNIVVFSAANTGGVYDIFRKTSSGVSMLQRASSPYDDALELIDMSEDGNTISLNCHDYSSGNKSKAGKWTQSGIQLLDPPSYYISSNSSAISGNGAVVIGTSHSPDLAYTGASLQGCFWNSSGVLTNLGDLVYPQDVSYDGDVIVGYLTPPPGLKKAFVWKPYTGMVLLPTLTNARDQSAELVSRDGSIVAGISLIGSKWVAFTWTVNEGIVPFFLSENENSFLQAINSKNEILGYSYNSTTLKTTNFVWSKSKGFTVLSDPQGYSSSLGIAISG